MPSLANTEGGAEGATPSSELQADETLVLGSGTYEAAARLDVTQAWGRPTTLAPSAYDIPSRTAPLPQMPVERAVYVLAASDVVLTAQDVRPPPRREAIPGIIWALCGAFVAVIVGAASFAAAHVWARSRVVAREEVAAAPAPVAVILESTPVEAASVPVVPPLAQPVAQPSSPVGDRPEPREPREPRERREGREGNESPTAKSATGAPPSTSPEGDALPSPPAYLAPFAASTSAPPSTNPPPSTIAASTSTVPPLAPSPSPTTGVVRVPPPHVVVVVDGRHRRVVDGEIVLSCGLHKIRAGLGDARVVDVPCGGKRSL